MYFIYPHLPDLLTKLLVFPNKPYLCRPKFKSIGIIYG